MLLLLLLLLLFFVSKRSAMQMAATVGRFFFIHFFCISVNFLKFVFIFSGCRIACVAVSLRCAPFSRRQKKEVYYSVFLGRLLSFHFYFVHFFYLPHNFLLLHYAHPFVFFFLRRLGLNPVLPWSNLFFIFFLYFSLH